MSLVVGREAATEYVDSRNFTEPLFVFAIMVVAGSRPILQLSTLAVKHVARLLPVPGQLATFFLALSLVPLFGSLITEPGAMTLAALMLRDRIFSNDISARLKYATVGALFVNVSIGGTLTPFAAPPVLMVAAKWGWDLPFMLSHFGWRAAIAVVINAFAVSFIFRREILGTRAEEARNTKAAVPAVAMIISGVFLLAVVMFAHHPAIFLGLLLFFIGYSAAYRVITIHDPARGLLVAFFLAVWWPRRPAAWLAAAPSHVDDPEACTTARRPSRP